MVFRPRILQDVAEYAIRTADRDLSSGNQESEPQVHDQPDLLSRSDRTSAHLTSASAIALGPWAVFALSFLILAAYGEDFEAALEAPLADTLDLEGLGKFSASLAEEPDPIPMFGQVARLPGQVTALGSTSVADAPSFAPEPSFFGPSIGPFALALVPDETFGRGIGGRNGLSGLTDDRDRISLENDTGGFIKQIQPVQFDDGDSDEGGGENGGGDNGHGEDGGGPGEGDGNGPGEGGPDEEGGGVALVISGGSGDDILVGTNGNDAIFGGSGDDTITGKNGNDILVAAPGNDILDGSGGWDVAAFDAPSKDFVIHRNTDGTFAIENHATGDVTHIVGIEVFYFSDGYYQISDLPDAYGRLVTDGLLNTASNTQKLLDDAGVGSGGGDDDGPEDDFINGTSGDDNLVGTELGDIIFGFTGNDQLTGLAGDDILIAGPGNDTVDGGAGQDIAAFEDASGNYTLYRNEDGSFTVENDETGEETQLIGVENVYFTDGNYDLAELSTTVGPVDTTGLLDTQKTTQTLIDEITGDGNENDPTFGGGEILEGTDGDDQIVGTEFDDLIFGGPGNDQLIGFDGDDIIAAEPGNDFVDGGFGHDIAAFVGPSFSYRLSADQDGSFLLTNIETDEETRLIGVENLYFADGFIDISDIKGFSGPIGIDELIDTSKTTKDLLEANDSGGDDDVDILVPVPKEPGEVINGDEGDNELIGTNRDDLIIGGPGNDLLLGSGGNDILVPESGSDRVFGGNGQDVAAFQGLASGYALYLLSDGSFSVINGLTEEETILIDVETLYFKDGFIDLDRVDEVGLIETRPLLDRSDNTAALLDRFEDNQDGDGDGDGEISPDGQSQLGMVVEGDGKSNDLYGSDLNDLIRGFGGDDRISALAGNDIVMPGTGSNHVDGGLGIDVVAVDAPASGYSLYRMSDGSFSLLNNDNEDETVLTNVERLFFQDGSIDLIALKDAAGRIDIEALLDVTQTTADLPAPAIGDQNEEDGGKDGKDNEEVFELGYLISGDTGDNDLFGTDGNDFFFGGPGDDRISGFGGQDIIIAGPGNDFVDAGAGHDIAGFAGSSRDYVIAQNKDGSLTVTDTKSQSATNLVNVENLHFADGNVDITGLPGLEGVVYIGDLLDTDSSVEDLINLSDSYTEQPIGVIGGPGNPGRDGIGDEGEGEFGTTGENEGGGNSEPFVFVPPPIGVNYDSDYDANPVTGETS